jgi:hypothetical protein
MLVAGVAVLSMQPQELVELVGVLMVFLAQRDLPQIIILAVVVAQVDITILLVVLVVQASLLSSIQSLLQTQF